MHSSLPSECSSSALARAEVPATEGAGDQDLPRQIGTATAAAVVAGEIIAVGIFLTPAGMIKALGSPAWLLFTWLSMGTMALCGALCFAALATRFPAAGGSYVYLREAYGRLPAFLYGWQCFLVMDPGITAALAVGMARYAGQTIGLSPAGEKLAAVGGIGVLAAVNMGGIRLGAGMMRWLTAAKLAVLGLLVVWGFVSQRGDWSNFQPLAAQRSGSPPLLLGFAGAIVAAFFSFGGWWDLGKIAGEVRDPGKTLPRALTLGIIAVTAVYVLITGVFLYLVPAAEISSDSAFATRAGEILFGSAGAQLFGWIVILCIIGSLAGLIMTAPRVYFAMARDGLFPRGMAVLNRRTGSPVRAIALQSGLAALVAAIGGFERIVAYFIFVTVVFLAFTAGSVFLKRVAERPGWRIPFHPLPPTVFLVLVAVLLFLVGSANPRESVLGIAVVALGVPVYYLLERRRTS